MSALKKKPSEKRWETRLWNVRFAHPDQTDTKMSPEEKGDSWVWGKLNGKGGVYVSLIMEVKHGESMLAFCVSDC